LRIFNPDTGLFYVNTTQSYAYYLTDTAERPEGYGGRDGGVWSQTAVKAIDYRTEKIRWTHPFHGESLGFSGLLSTAGKLLFSGDPSGNLIAFEPASGRILWHAGLAASVSNAPMTFELDGRQYLVAGAGNMLYAFTLPDN
jgi:alcohol dehydrogenase (cytochrome c)